MWMCVLKVVANPLQYAEWFALRLETVNQTLSDNCREKKGELPDIRAHVEYCVTITNYLSQEFHLRYTASESLPPFSIQPNPLDKRSLVHKKTIIVKPSINR